MPIKRHRGYSTQDRFPTFRGERRIKMPQITKRPVRFQTRSIIRRGLLKKDPYWFILHKRGPRREWIGENALEARAAPHDLIRGTLPERIIWRYLTQNMHFVPDVDFDFQSCCEIHHKILTADLRWVSAGELQIGDQLFSFDENNENERRSWKVGTVVANSIDQVETMAVTLSNGQVVITTPEHPWLVHYAEGKHDWGRTTGYAWVQTKDLKAGVYIPKFMDTWEHDTSNKAGWLAGFFDGEGSVVHSKSSNGSATLAATLGQNPSPMLDRFLEYMQDMNFRFSIYDYNGKYKRSYDDGKRKVITCRIAGGRAEVLKFLGTIRPAKIANLKIDKLGKMTKKEDVQVVSIEPSGVRSIARLGVDTHTYIAEGFGMHNSLQGGRIDTGGIVADFKFFYLRIVINPLGPTHEEFRRIRKDDEQISALEEMGYQVYMIWEDEVYDEAKFDEIMKRIFGWTHSGGSDTVPDIDDLNSDGFIYEPLYRSVLELRNSI